MLRAKPRSCSHGHRWSRLTSLVDSISWLGFFRGFLSSVRQMSRNLGHIRPRLSYGHRIKVASISTPVLICRSMDFIFFENTLKKHKHVQFTFLFQVCGMMYGIWPPLQRWYARTLSVKFAKTAWQLVEFPPLSRGSFGFYWHIPMI